MATTTQFPVLTVDEALAQGVYVPTCFHGAGDRLFLVVDEDDQTTVAWNSDRDAAEATARAYR